tara:strand:+ start:1474 stop:1953 length:480 start_codon:yes stop_codon:yes gene_type:complete
LKAIPKLKPTFYSPKGALNLVSSDNRELPNAERNLNLDNSSEKFSEDGQDKYMQLQLRIYLLTLIITGPSVLIFAIFFDLHSALSLLIGALSGILYLRLLARGIEKLGKTSMSVSKVQLLVPVLLFFAVSRLPQLELLPALVGFLLYKLSLIIQFSLEP